jgi:hypothetical protein
VKEQQFQSFFPQPPGTLMVVMETLRAIRHPKLMMLRIGTSEARQVKRE